MQKIWDPELSASVVRLREQLIADKTANRWQREASEASGGLSVYEGWGGSIVIMPTGEVLLYDSETRATRPLDDRRWGLIGLAKAARTYAELKRLMPTPSQHANTCSVCAGSGKSRRPELAAECEQCWGLGWIEAPADNDPLH